MTKRNALFCALVSLASMAVPALAGTTEPAAAANKPALQCMAAASIVFKFSRGEKQLANVRDDESFQSLNRSVTARAMQVLSALSEQQLYEGMNRHVPGEAKLMSERVFPNDNRRLSDDELGERLKQHMRSRFDKVGCLKG